MINVNDVYLDTLDRINESENGQMSNNQFNRFSWLGQLACIDWISGDVSGIVPPEPYRTQKNKSWLSPFIKKYPVQVINGKITKPIDYYNWENAYIIGDYTQSSECDTDEELATISGCNTSIEILNGDQFYKRCHTFIEGLQPSFTKPICKEIGQEFDFLPLDLGSITLEYIKLPIKSKRAVKLDIQYNEEVYDAVNSIDFEWPEYARPILTWFISDLFFNYTREQAGKTFNIQTGKTVRDSK